MKRAVIVAMLALVPVACSSSVKPVPIVAGDVCFRCRRSIDQLEIAAELVDSAGRAFRFKSATCLAIYLKTHPEENSTIFVTDYSTRRLVPGTDASFVQVVMVKGYQQTSEFIAFKKREEADAAAAREKSTVTDWAGVVAAAPNY